MDRGDSRGLEQASGMRTISTRFQKIGCDARRSADLFLTLSQTERGLVAIFSFFLTLLVLFSWAACASAGGGPEGVLLVVNPESANSMTIANYYARLRGIPPSNIIYVPWPVKSETGDIDTFRQKLLLPILHTIDRLRLGNQIDYVVYSSDFPWGIALNSDVRKFSEMMRPAMPPPDKKESEDKPDSKKPDQKSSASKSAWPQQLTPVGSINSLTYLWQAVIAGRPDYFSLRINNYMRPPTAEPGQTSSAGFHGNRLYRSEGEGIGALGHRYFLSTMLGVTTGRGNTLDEVLRYLERSAAADGTRPKGTIYFLKNGDIRSKVRQPLFPAMVQDLEKLGVAAEIVEGTMPMNKKDVQGAVMGIADFNWKASGSTILPGAICEHFTSFGGVMKTGAGQTPLSEFLRYGAAGASGTVTEPYAIPEKFPSPTIQVHYARGCTLAEAFYQSVYGPYQLLIVGDPLCRPWAQIPKVTVTGIEPDTAIQGNLTLTPSATTTENKSVERFDLFVDGLRAAECKPGETLSLDTARLSDGHHELRVVAIGPAPIESQGRWIVPVKTENHGRTIEASLTNQAQPRADMPLSIAVRSPGSMGILVLQGSRVVGRLTGEAGQIEIRPNTLGAGPVQLRAVGLGKGGTETNVLAKPIDLMLK